jgi:hypothetical protein
LENQKEKDKNKLSNYNNLQVELIATFIMSFRIDEIFINNPEFGMKKFYEMWNEYKLDFDFDNDAYIAVNNVEKEIETFNLILKECKEEFMQMYLFQAVSIFENMLNDFYHDELMNKYGFSGSKANSIIASLRTNDKVDWFLQMTIGKSYKGEEGWGIIKPFIDARNFFIHYKPEKNIKYDKHLEMLSKTNIQRFLKETINFYEFLYKHSENIRRQRDNFEKVQELLRVGW